jgi:hypothetical protein
VLTRRNNQIFFNKIFGGASGPKRTHLSRFPTAPEPPALAGDAGGAQNDRGSECVAARRGGGPFKRPREESVAMIRKLKSGEYRLYSRKKDPKTGKRRNLGTFKTRAAAQKHERAVQYFKRH